MEYLTPKGKERIRQMYSLKSDLLKESKYMMPHMADEEEYQDNYKKEVKV